MTGTDPTPPEHALAHPKLMAFLLNARWARWTAVAPPRWHIVEPADRRLSACGGALDEGEPVRARDVLAGASRRCRRFGCRQWWRVVDAGRKP